MSSTFFEVRAKSNGKFFSRHFWTRTPYQAAQRFRNSNRVSGKIISVRKVNPTDILGNMRAIASDVVSEEPPQDSTMFEGITLEGIVFSGNRKEKSIRKQRRRDKAERDRNRAGH